MNKDEGYRARITLYTPRTLTVEGQCAVSALVPLCNVDLTTRRTLKKEPDAFFSVAESRAKSGHIPQSDGQAAIIVYSLIMLMYSRGGQ